MALGYYITLDKPPSRIRSVRLANEPFLQSNGYKPSPLDLSAVTLTPKMEELVDQLAENTHNLWAKERIGQGWTYGLNEVWSHTIIRCVLIFFISILVWIFLTSKYSTRSSSI